MHPCDITRPADAQQIIALASQRQVDGLVVSPPVDDATSLLQTLTEMNIPFVRLTPRERDSSLPYVAATDRLGGFEMAQYLVAIGHRRIGYVHGPREWRAPQERFAGFREALALTGVDYDETLVRYSNDHFEGGQKAAASLLGMDPRPTAIFCNNDEMAAGACAVAHEAGLAIPSDISVAGFDDVAQIWPPLTTVCQPIYTIARIATQMLISLLDCVELIIPHIEIPTHLIIRASTAPPRDRLVGGDGL
jgi:LacI family transcriptional regulator